MKKKKKSIVSCWSLNFDIVSFVVIYNNVLGENKNNIVLLVRFNVLDWIDRLGLGGG